MKIYSLSTFNHQDYTSATWFYTTSREKAETLVEETVAKVKLAQIKLQKADTLWKELWAVCDGLDYDRYEAMRKSIQSRLAWSLLCDIKNHYEPLFREEVLNANIEDLKNRIYEVEADVISPLIEQEGD